MKQYLQLLKTILKDGDEHQDRTGVGTTSIFGYQLRHNMADGFPLLTTKRLSFKWIAQELRWFLSGSTNEQDLRDLGGAKPITIWEDWAGKDTCAKFGRPPQELGPIYGQIWRNFGATKRDPSDDQSSYIQGNRKINWGYNHDGFDQIEFLQAELKKNPRSRRMLLIGFHPGDALNVSVPGCHSLANLKWHEETNRLDLQMYQRSADVFLGVPYNIASYALLLSMFAETIGAITGDYIHTFGDVHIYNNHREQVAAQLEREPKALPELLIKHRDDILDFTYDDFSLLNYSPEASIKAEVAV